MYDHVIDENIFPSFVCSCIPQIDMMSQLEEAYDIENRHPSENLSNEGGYHSPTFVGTKFSKLRDIVEKFSNDLLDQKGLGLSVSNIEYWCNINKSYNYNVMHSHGRADLIGIYYIQLPPNSGNLVVMRNDGSQYCDLYENRADMLEYIIEHEVGRLYVLPGHLWHYVTGSDSVRDRVSVSFNIYT
jgi:uncharacterized protein (TIGR02466 family)